MKKILTITATIVIILLSSCYYLMFYSNIPFSLVESLLNHAEVPIKNISGNLNTGFSIEALKYVSKKSDIEMENFIFKYNTFSKKVVHIKEISIAKFHLNQKRDRVIKWEEKGSKFKKKIEKLGSKPIQIKIDLIDLKDIKIKLAKNSPPISIKRLMIKNFALIEHKFSAEEFSYSDISTTGAGRLLVEICLNWLRQISTNSRPAAGIGICVSPQKIFCFNRP